MLHSDPEPGRLGMRAPKIFLMGQRRNLGRGDAEKPRRGKQVREGEIKEERKKSPSDKQNLPRASLKEKGERESELRSG